jgi:hypothetical protein
MFKDPAFHEQYKKLVGDEPSPLAAEELQKVINEMPRHAEVVELMKSLDGAGPLPPR